MYVRYVRYVYVCKVKAKTKPGENKNQIYKNNDRNTKKK